MNNSHRSSQRTTNRETETVNQQLQKCLKFFLDKRKAGCIFDKDHVSAINPDALKVDFVNNNANWKKFCTIWNKTGGHTVQADHTAFVKYVNEFSEGELRIMWTEELKKIMEVTFLCFAYTDEDYANRLKITSNEHGIATPEKSAGEVSVDMIGDYFKGLTAPDKIELIEPEPPKKEKLIEFLKRCNKVLFTPELILQPEHNFPTGYIVTQTAKDITDSLAVLPAQG